MINVIEQGLHYLEYVALKYLPRRWVLFVFEIRNRSGAQAFHRIEVLAHIFYRFPDQFVLGEWNEALRKPLGTSLEMLSKHEEVVVILRLRPLSNCDSLHGEDCDFVSHVYADTQFRSVGQFARDLIRVEIVEYEIGPRAPCERASPGPSDGGVISPFRRIRRRGSRSASRRVRRRF